MKGSFKLATRAGVPIVPISLDGTRHMFEDTGVLSPATINIIVHEPIETKGLSRQEEKDLHDRVERIVVDGVRELAARSAEDGTEERVTGEPGTEEQVTGENGEESGPEENGTE